MLRLIPCVHIKVIRLYLFCVLEFNEEWNGQSEIKWMFPKMPAWSLLVVVNVVLSDKVGLCWKKIRCYVFLQAQSIIVFFSNIKMIYVFLPQSCSSLLSPQLSYPLQPHLWLTQSPLLHLNWYFSFVQSIWRKYFEKLWGYICRIKPDMIILFQTCWLLTDCCFRDISFCVFAAMFVRVTWNRKKYIICLYHIYLYLQ